MTPPYANDVATMKAAVRVVPATWSNAEVSHASTEHAKWTDDVEGDLAPPVSKTDLLNWAKSMSGGDTSHMLDI